jgi:predicted lipoprotein
MLLSMQHSKKLSPILIGALLVFASCNNASEPSPADNTKDRKVILVHWADNIIIPSYEKFEGVFDIMTAKAEAFTSSPDQTSLAALRLAWVDAYSEWQNVELFEFGPADKYTLRNFFNIYPTDVNGIVANMNDPSVNLDLPVSYARQGFPALDYLINGLAADDAGIINAYTADADAPKRIAYFNRVTSRMNTLLDKVVLEWSGAYRETFINNTGLDIGSSTGTVVNAFILHYERYIRSGKIGIPSGTAFGSSGLPFPEKVEAYYKRDISLALAENAHAAAMGFFNGTDIRNGENGPSLKSYLDALGAKDPSTGTLLSDIINGQFNAISAELLELSPDFYEQIQTDNQEMVDSYAAMQKLVRLLKVDMTSAMSVTITYTDNDGD